MMKFFVQKQRIELLERDAIAADQIAFVPLHFVFDGAWEGLHKVVQITQCCETYNLILGTDGKSCLLPSECKAGTIKLSSGMLLPTRKLSVQRPFRFPSISSLLALFLTV